MKKRGVSFRQSIYLILVLIVFVITAFLSVTGQDFTGFAVYSTAGEHIYGCGNITAAGTYHLNQSINMTTDAGSTGYGIFRGRTVCLFVQANGVTIDFNGSSISANQSYSNNQTAIALSNVSTGAYTGLTLRNISLNGFAIAVEASADAANTVGGNVTIINRTLVLTDMTFNFSGRGSGGNGRLTLNFTDRIIDNNNTILGENLSLRVINGSNGEIYWFGFMNGTSLANVLDTNISIGKDYFRVSVDQTTRSLNGSANVSFYAHGRTDLGDADVLKDGVDCADCTNLTSLNIRNPVFNVSSWSNYTIGDITPPRNITFNSPLVDSTTTASSIKFNITLNENSTARFTLEGGRVNVSMTGSETAFFGVHFNYTNSSIADGTYQFVIYANDTSGNNNFTANITFIVDAPPVTTTASSSSSGGGATASIPVVIKITDTELTSGATRIVTANKKLVFNAGSEKIVEHSVKVVKIDGNAKTVDLLVESDAIELTIAEGKSRKVDLDNDGIYDLLIEVLSISIAGTNTELKLISINEEIPSGEDSVSDEEEGAGVGSDLSPLKEKGVGLQMLIGIVVIVVLVILGIIVYMRKKKFR